MLLLSGETADSPSFYLQLLGTYLVSTVPNAGPKPCALAVALPIEVQPQSILPVAVPDKAIATGAPPPAGWMYGLSTIVFAPAASCGIATGLYMTVMIPVAVPMVTFDTYLVGVKAATQEVAAALSPDQTA